MTALRDAVRRLGPAQLDAIIDRVIETTVATDPPPGAFRLPPALVRLADGSRIEVRSRVRQSDGASVVVLVCPLAEGQIVMERGDAVAVATALLMASGDVARIGSTDLVETGLLVAGKRGTR